MASVSAGDVAVAVDDDAPGIGVLRPARRQTSAAAAATASVRSPTSARRLMTWRLILGLLWGDTRKPGRHRQLAGSIAGLIDGLQHVDVARVYQDVLGRGCSSKHEVGVLVHRPHLGHGA